MLLFSLLVLTVPMLFGVAVAAAAELLQEKVRLIALGALLGLALFTTAAYIINATTGLSAILVVLLTLITGAATLIVLAKTQAWTYWRQQPTDYVGLAVLAALSVFVGIVSSHLLFEKDGTLSVGVINAWGDLPWHMANIMNFAEGQSVPPQNPIFSGTRLTYPFLSNFLSAMLITVGASFPASVVLPALILIPCGLALLYGIGVVTTKRRVAAVLITLLFVFAGGTLGWTRIFSDFSHSAQPLTEFLLHLPKDYTGNGGDADSYHFLNPLLSLFLPQRSFLLGIPLALAILLLLTNPRRTHYTYIMAGLLAGLLPLFHGHTVLALIPPILALFFLDVLGPSSGGESSRNERLQNWILFVLLAGIIGIPEILYYARGSGQQGSFFRWGPGWTAGEQNLLWFWFKNTGFLIPLTAAGFFLAKHRVAKALAAAGLIVFVAANLYVFAPWPWDNFKLLIFWLLLVLPLVGSLLAYLWQRGVVAKIAVAVLVAFQCVTGVIDLTKTALPTAPYWGEWDADAIDIARRIRSIVPAQQAVVVAPYHNNPVALAGRPVYLGFTGHVWSHGGTPWAREKAVPEFYQGRLTQLPEDQPRYVLVGPVERQRYPQIVVGPLWQLVAQNEQYQLYQLHP